MITGDGKNHVKTLVPGNCTLVKKAGVAPAEKEKPPAAADSGAQEGGAGAIAAAEAPGAQKAATAAETQKVAGSIFPKSALMDTA